VIHENSKHTILVGDAEKSSDQMNEIFIIPARKKFRFTTYTIATILILFLILFTVWYLFRNGLTAQSVSGKSKLTPKEAPASYQQAP
jgi:hypothetical protein